MKSKVLGDHFQEKKKLIPPFLHSFPNFNPISWDSVTIPEIIWISLILNELGEKNGIEFVLQVCTCLAIDKEKYPVHSTAMLSNMDLLNAEEKSATLEALHERNLLLPLRNILHSFISIYAECPLNFIFTSKVNQNVNIFFVESMKDLLSELYDRLSKASVFSASAVVYNQFVNGNLVVSESTSLARFPEIQHYPETEISRQIASAVRATVKQLHIPTLFNVESGWGTYFWQTTYNLEPCKI